jgi:hypothetical protein
MDKKAVRLWEKLADWKYVLVVALAGLALLLWPSGQSTDQQEQVTEETKLACLLTQIEGVGETELILSDRGAVVVCQGADNASVRLAVAQAVRCYTGLGTDRVQIFKMEQ